MTDSNENIQMITGDPKKAIVKLAIPMMISMLLIMLYNIADSIICRLIMICQTMIGFTNET